MCVVVTHNERTGEQEEGIMMNCGCKRVFDARVAASVHLQIIPVVEPVRTSDPSEVLEIAVIS
jgi:hypothetical protein